MPSGTPPSDVGRGTSWADFARGFPERVKQRPAGRFLTDCIDELSRVEIFDRSMTLAAQIFTSVFPLLILLAVFLSRTTVVDVSEAFGVPPATQRVIESALASSSDTLGVLGLIFVLLSATSLSRAMARAFAVIWRLPRPQTRVSLWWRWLAVVVGLSITLIAVRALVRLAEGLTPTPVWTFTFVAVVFGVFLFVASYVLLEGRVPARALIVGAALGGLLVAVTGRVSALLLARTLESSEERYGVIGVAFSYIGFLYALSFAIIAAAVVGSVVVRMDNRVGALLRGSWQPPLHIPAH